MTALGIEALLRGWAVLRAPQQQELAAYQLELTVAGGVVRLALDSTGRRHLLLPLGNEKLPLDRGGGVLVAEVRRLVFEGSTQEFLDVTCLDTSLYQEFDDFLLDLLEAVRTAVAAPGAAALMCLLRWRRLFAAAASRSGLRVHQALGLFAELLVVERGLEVVGALQPKEWTGPAREPHDFELPHACVEVKAAGANTDSVRVHGFEQLAQHGGRPLYVYLVRLEEHELGRTLDQIVEAVLNRAGTARSDWSALLRATGWRRGDSSGATPWAATEELLAVVDDQMPRIVPTSFIAGVPSGLRDLEYSLTIDDLRRRPASDALEAVLVGATR